MTTSFSSFYVKALINYYVFTICHKLPSKSRIANIFDSSKKGPSPAFTVDQKDDYSTVYIIFQISGNVKKIGLYVLHNDFLTRYWFEQQIVKFTLDYLESDVMVIRY